MVATAKTAKRKTTIRCLLAIRACFKVFASFTYLINFKILNTRSSRMALIVFIEEMDSENMNNPKYAGNKEIKSINP